ncbi:bacteriohemerythrin [Desulfovibrio sp. SGI.169]|uniref:bacteriohemerythrin n=1 Tax=Desulfovibrio sp. SGI.169 TaxID=3420561 RepID=UPI003CFF3CE6
MKRFIWENCYLLGVHSLDKAHQEIFTVANRIYNLLSSGACHHWTAKQGILYLNAYVLKHFDDEENYMLSINYPDYENHKAIHDEFRFIQLKSLEDDLISNDYNIYSIKNFVEVIDHWIRYIMKDDKNIDNYFRATQIPNCFEVKNHSGPMMSRYGSGASWF